jgi:hypothetical protein
MEAPHTPAYLKCLCSIMLIAMFQHFLRDMPRKRRLHPTSMHSPAAAAAAAVRLQLCQQVVQLQQQLSLCCLRRECWWRCFSIRLVWACL